MGILVIRNDAGDEVRLNTSNIAYFEEAGDGVTRLTLHTGIKIPDPRYTKEAVEAEEQKYEKKHADLLSAARHRPQRLRSSYDRQLMRALMDKESLNKLRKRQGSHTMQDTVDVRMDVKSFESKFWSAENGKSMDFTLITGPGANGSGPSRGKPKPSRNKPGPFKIG